MSEEGNGASSRVWRALTCPIMKLLVFSSFIYWALAYLMPVQTILELARILASTAAMIGAVSFAGEAWEVLSGKEKDRTDSLVVGIWLFSVCTVITNFWLLLYRLAGRPPEMLNVLTFGYLSGWLTSVACLLLVWAPGVLRRGEDGVPVPPSRLRAVGIATALGVFGTLIVLATQPSAILVWDTLRPWLP